MLANLNDPKSIGGRQWPWPFITTFYGSTMATVIFLPIATKLKARTLQEELHLEVIFEGAKSILENNNPMLVYEKLSSFLAPKERK
jgi:chemotaxis protein MotA